MRVEVLNAGYVELVEAWGSDERIIEAARMSTNKGFQGWGNKETPGDEKLLSFLWKNGHATPFEMAGAIIEVQAPIFVFREWHRHRTQSYNELSARYTPLPDTNYIPDPNNVYERCHATTGNKQAQGTGKRPITAAEIKSWIGDLRRVNELAQQVYQDGLNLGIPKELARLPVPVARYSRMRASANLRNWLGFLTLRMAPNAQEEIRLYANAVHSMLVETFPRTLALFDEGRA